MSFVIDDPAPNNGDNEMSTSAESVSTSKLDYHSTDDVRSSVDTESNQSSLHSSSKLSLSKCSLNDQASSLTSTPEIVSLPTKPKTTIGLSLRDQTLNLYNKHQSTAGDSLESKDTTMSLSNDNPTTEKCKPHASFEELGVSPEVRSALESMKIEGPNELQTAVLTELLVNKQTKDVFIRSKPRSGKKMAFLISMIERIDVTANRVQCVILQPSLDLVAYTAGLAKDIGSVKNVQVDYATDDDSFTDLKGHIIVSTTSLFDKFLRSRKTTGMNAIDCLLFDEIDLQTSDKYNLENVSRAIRLLKGKVGQVQFYSNSFHPFTLKAVKRMCSDLAMIDLLKRDCLSNYLHFSIVTETRKKKYLSLLKVLEHTVCDKVIIYCNSMPSAEFVFGSLKSDGYRQAILLHFESTAQDRLIAINNFNQNAKAILVLNYPITQGIPLINTFMVINYQIPTHLQEMSYFHRITKCTNIEEKPNFVVNLFDLSYHETLRQLSQLEESFGKMIKLDVGSLARRKDAN